GDVREVVDTRGLPLQVRIAPRYCQTSRATSGGAAPERSAHHDERVRNRAKP
ncbi:MAG: hypothetical protein QOF37_2319, partial [Thermoleophilaceae bacterium]|nr:hypothetical protein [Thermoleophilaceae bacterium]